MTKLAPLGIKRLEGIHYYVHDLERSRGVLHEQARLRRDLALAPGARGAAAASRLACFQAGNVTVVVLRRRVGEGGRAGALPRRSTPTASAR